MTFPCFGCDLSTGALLLGWFDVVLTGMSLLSFFQWFNMIMESATLSDRAWSFYNLSPKVSALVTKNCGLNYFINYDPHDLGIQLRKSVTLFSLASMGYIIAGLFLIYSTISAPDTSRLLLEVFIACNLTLIVMSTWAAHLLQSDKFCIFEYDGVSSHEGRHALLWTLTMFFIGYKLYELLVVVCQLCHLKKLIATAVDPQQTRKMSYGEIRAAQIATPSTSRSGSIIIDLDKKCIEIIPKDKPLPEPQPDNNNNVLDCNGNNLYLDPEVMKFEMSVVGQSLTRVDINLQQQQQLHQSQSTLQGQGATNSNIVPFALPSNFYSPFQHSEY